MFIVKVPGINSSDGSTNGCERSGEAVIKELRKINTNEFGKEINVDALDIEEIHLDNSNLKLTEKLIYDNSLETFETKSKTVFLGGDGSITFPIAKAFFDYCKNSGSEPCLIVFDAHADCKKPKEYPTYEEWLRKLVDSGFPARNILLVGARNFGKDENSFIEDNKIKIVKINSITEDIHETCDTIMEFSSGKELYVSIDADVLDQNFAPSVPKPEIGGLTSREFLYIIQRINKIKNLRGIDIVGINMEKDKENKNITVKIGAKILSELI